MKFMLLGDWPTAGGSLTVPASTVIEYDPDPEAARLAGIPTAPMYLGTVLPTPLPLNARCEDQSAYDQMVRWIEPQSDQLMRTIHYAPSVLPKKG
ncbi:hypothetical protein [Bradyrhizobium embrapense]